MLARCVGAYAVSRHGVLRLLLDAHAVPEWVHPTDHFMNNLAAFDPALRSGWFEPPLVCQARGLGGSRTCFAATSCPPAELRSPVHEGVRLSGELGVEGCGKERYVLERAVTPAHNVPLLNMPPLNMTPPTAGAAAIPGIERVGHPRTTRTSQAASSTSVSEYASLLRTEPSCHTPSEETLPWIVPWLNNRSSHEPALVLNVGAEDGKFFPHLTAYHALTDRSTAKRRQVALQHVGPIFFHSHTRPVKVAIARVVQMEGASAPNTSWCQARRPSVFVPIFKAASSTILLGVLPTLYPGLGAVWGPHARLTSAEAAGASVHLGGRSYQFSEGPLSTSKELLAHGALRESPAHDATMHHHDATMPAHDATHHSSAADDNEVKPLFFTVVRDPFARFISAFKPHETSLPLCNGRPCNATIRLLGEHAKLLERGPPAWLAHPAGGYGVWAHWLSQTYHLSGTGGMKGETPIRFSHVLRIERLDEDLLELSRAVGATPGCKVTT
uniref:Uncharacterized protein n=1 Tax=Haptolina brevifila TaxID=156173 RepID=A0A7S2NS99_9EUKA|mmetsp:Transcript_924/g.1925  ORF Transcript_924/g.1925 Transcript_924/m.1925 type:complete len:499 (+) Transcript_924:335-1831(+)